MKRLGYVFGFLVLLLLAAICAVAFPGVMEGFGGIVIWTFLAYCALIVVAQLISAMIAARKMIEGIFDDYYTKKKSSKQIMLR
ncbi:hypothetical protein DESUT3_37330 [Desulfuromonas versatilis]|uniref:Uncharacterized protein n=1 Tax=Desulfuromonas versatilis TaxID=2802975 RepID=A0ABN6E5U4_9BACT|nr:hypothetical protein [Desulfuromonas versatilis]BCR06664.1 hypothetical protein DESUT3_37330 [Desulfuromonas versatilis]